MSSKTTKKASMSSKKASKQEKKEKQARKQARNESKSVFKGRWYYWSDDFLNEQGENLVTCLEKYGTGGWTSAEKDMKAALIYLDASCDEGHAWLKSVDRLSTGEQATIRLHEEDADTYRIPASWIAQDRFRPIYPIW
jgi:hypothetical protein